MDKLRLLPWYVSACTLAVTPFVYLFIPDLMRVSVAMLLEVVLLFWFSFLARQRNNNA